MALDLARIRASVARNTSVDGSAREFIRSVPQLIRDAIAADDVQDATHLNALADEIDASSDSVVAAITENTPAAGSGSAEGGTTGGSTEGGAVTP